MVRYKLRQLHKCWHFHTPSHLLPFGAVVDHPSLQKKCSPIHGHKQNSMSASTCVIVQRPYYVLFRAMFCTGLHTKSTVLVRRNYDHTTIMVQECLFGSYCIWLCYIIMQPRMGFCDERQVGQLFDCKYGRHGYVWRSLTFVELHYCLPLKSLPLKRCLTFLSAVSLYPLM